jgi:hypothetical protein
MMPPQWRRAVVGVGNWSLIVAVLMSLSVGGFLGRSTLVAAQSLSQPQDPSFFPATGYRINSPAILSYFQQHGGVRTIGYPVSNDFPLLGKRVQIFQRQVLEIRPDGTVAPTNVLTEDFLPITHMDGLILPSIDPDLVGSAPSVSSPDYLSQARSFVSVYVPDVWNDLPVNFQTTYLESVSCADAFGDQPCDPSQLAALAFELWGLPTSQPTADTLNGEFVYQRFERGIMHFSTATGLTQGLLVGDWVKRVLIGLNLSPDLDSAVLRSPLYNQFAPSRPLGLARPNELPDTTLAQAFRADTLTAAAQQMGTATLPPGVAETATAVAATATAITATQIALQETQIALTATAVSGTATAQAGGPTPTVQLTGAVSDIPVTNEGCMGDEQMWFIPRRPNIGTHVEIAITSRRHHDLRFVRLVGPVDAGVPTERLGPLGFVWTWTVVPAVEAFHQWTFYADGLRPCITSGFNAFAPLGATPTPTNTPEPTATPGTPTSTPLPQQPHVTLVDPASGECGSILRIQGSNFGASQAEVNGSVRFSGAAGVTAQEYLSWNDREVNVAVPSALRPSTAYQMIVITSGGQSPERGAPTTFTTAAGPSCEGT